MTCDLDLALEEAQNLVSNVNDLVRVVLSGKRKSMNPPHVRVDLRPVSIKSKIFLQVVTSDGRQATTQNADSELFDFSKYLGSGYANILVEHKSGSLSIRFSKKDKAQIIRSAGENQANLSHDRPKVHLLAGTDPFLKEVGIADIAGNIKPSRQDKYRQVEEFLRLLAPTLESAIAAKHLSPPTVESPLTIVDLGCGNAYLTFAVHQYLRKIGMPIHVTGIDIRPDSRLKNLEIAKRLGIQKSIEFRWEEIATTTLESADIVLSLHACDTATDDAIAWGVLHGAPLLFIAPCCHHDLQSQLAQIPEPWQLLTRHGLLKERFVDLMTDAIRAQILKIMGYRTEVIEFIGGEHTPRNLMIRAVRTSAKAEQIDIDRYLEMLEKWDIAPALATRLSLNLENRLQSRSKAKRTKSSGINQALEDWDNNKGKFESEPIAKFIK